MSQKRKRAAVSTHTCGDKIHENWIKGSKQQANMGVTMPRQPTSGGRQNGCWVPPVVALANFYNLKPSLDFIENGFGNANTDADDADSSDSSVEVGTAVQPSQEPSQDEVGDKAVNRVAPKVTGNLVDPVGNDKGNDPKIDPPPLVRSNACDNVKVTVESVLTLWPGDDAQGVFEVMETLFGVCVVGDSWGNHNTNDEFCGPTHSGDGNVSERWFKDLRVTIDNNNLVVLLVERLDSGKDKGNIHYLLVLGYKEEIRRRGTRYALHVKDGMEEDTLLEAMLWDTSSVELTTKVPNGTTLDRYKILESVNVTM
eukprot:m.267893 g.267893  ORF g.267893 m.267893 type:complete len:312 (+) comp75244_c0_seq1:119-1054(+)